MTEEIAGFQTSPKAQVQVAFEEIARRSMHDLFSASFNAGVCF